MYYTSTYILFLSYSNDKFYILKQNLDLWVHIYIASNLIHCSKFSDLKLKTLL